MKVPSEIIPVGLSMGNRRQHWRHRWADFVSDGAGIVGYPNVRTVKK
jgi:hypothetical protein